MLHRRILHRALSLQAQPKIRTYRVIHDEEYDYYEITIDDPLQQIKDIPVIEGVST